MFFPARQDFYSSHGSGELISKGAFTRSQSLSYAMSLPVATTISGMDSMEVLDQNLAILRGFKTLSAGAPSSMTGIWAAASTVIPHLLNFQFEQSISNSARFRATARNSELHRKTNPKE